MKSLRNRSGTLAVLLAALSMIGPFSIDTIFPAFVDIRDTFGVTDTLMQQTISVYMLAYAVVCLVHGPVSDACGRKPVIVIGMSVYALASVGAALAGSMTALLAWRVLQGVSAGAGIVVGRAVVRDHFEGAAAQRLMAQMMLIFGIAPAIAPVVGAWLMGLGGWRSIFWALAVFALVLVLATGWLLDESHPRERRVPLRVGSLAASYAGVLRDRPFWPLVVSGTVNFGAVFLYIVSAPAFVLDLLHLSRQGFPWLFVPIIGGLTLGSWWSGRMAGRQSAETTVNLGYAMMLVSAAINLTLAWVWPEPRLPWSVLPLMGQAAGAGLAFPTLTLLLLDRFPARRGMASSMQASISLLFGALLAGVISPWLSHTAWHLALGSGAIAMIGYASWRIYGRLARRELAAHRAAGLAEVAPAGGPVT